MNWKQAKKQWSTVQQVVKRTWGRIDETDLAMIHGERDSFVRILAQRYGYEDAVAQQKVDAFIDELKPASSRPTGLTWFSRLRQRCWEFVHVPRHR